MDLLLSKGTGGDNRAEAISSKSYVHRLLIAASLCDKDITVDTNIVSKDMEATMRTLAALKGVKIAPPASDVPVELDCGESGSTARFILPLAAFILDSAVVTGSGKLPERPMGPLCDVLRAAGVSVSDDHLPITVSGRPHAGNYSIPGNVSSQFISGLLFMLPLLDGDSTLTIEGELESAAYVDMTLDVLAKFGITVRKTASGFEIPGGQKYSYPSGEDKIHIKAEGDWSNGAYVCAIGSLGCGRYFDTFSISGLNPESIQGDRAAVDVMKEFGIGVDVLRDAGADTAEYVIKGRPQKPVDVECSQIPDLVPALAVLAAFADGDSVFRNVSRLRMKECDRIEAVKDMLGEIGISVDITSENGSENMTVCGRGGDVSLQLSDGSEHITIDSFNDHRIAMAAAAIAFAADTPVMIRDAMAVDKSYPGFYDLVEKLGMSVRRM